jgi:DNA-directed RNA polymerase specialized sigma24 family protein
VNPSAAATAGSKRHLAAVPDAGGVFAKYSAQIFAYCLHSLGSASDAEDALQTTFLQAHRAIQRGDVPNCESAWLTAIAKNACRWQHRIRRRRATASANEDGP